MLHCWKFIIFKLQERFGKYCHILSCRRDREILIVLRVFVFFVFQEGFKKCCHIFLVVGETGILNCVAYFELQTGTVK